MEPRARYAILAAILVGCAGARPSPEDPSAHQTMPNASPQGAPEPSPEPPGGEETRLDASSAPATDAAATRAHAHDPGRSIDDIRAIVVAHRDEARACYDKAAAAHPGIQGDLVMRWKIDPKGVVGTVTADAARSQIAEPTLVACVADVIKTIRFAPSPRGFETSASYPFNFRPRTPPKASP